VYNRRKEGNLDEQRLIANARRGDAGAFEELVRRRHVSWPHVTPG
jgi:hypothetical protein